MDRRIKKRMEQELSDRIEELSTLEPGTDEYESALKGISVLTSSTLEAENGRKDRAWKIVTTLVEIGVPLACYGVWFQKGLDFETQGAAGSGFFRNLINSFKPFKKM